MSNLTKNQRKELLRKSEHDTHVASELQRERGIGEDPFWRGIGERLIQVREISAFGRGLIWDVRRTEDQLKLYVSELNPERPGYLVPGYTQLDIESEKLASLVSALGSAKVVLLPAGDNIGLDGTTMHVEFKNGFASAGFSWWEKGPPEWSELVQLVRTAVDEFKVLPNPSFKRTPDGAA